MGEPVAWRADGTPESPRFSDIYRSASGGLAQAQHVFLAGCGLPDAWRGQRQWRILETGFGLGLNFLATWRAWKDDPARPDVLHMASIEAFPVAADDLVRSAEAHPQLQPLAQDLARQWWGLVPGVHRLAFEEGRVLLTVLVGDVQDMLAELAHGVDSVFLDGFDPRRNPAMWSLPALKAIARLCGHGTRLATWTAASDVRRDLAQCGFSVERTPGLPPKRHCIRATFAPAWTPRGQRPRDALQPTTCTVVGAGLAGAAVAASLARRGWQVTVLDAAAQPAAGASALPAGLLAPHLSPDDNLLSRLSRAGLRITRAECATRLRAGEAWGPIGALEQRERALPLQDAVPFAADWHAPAAPEQCAAAGLARPQAAWHAQAAWVRPAALVQAWLHTPGVRFVGGARVARLQARAGGGWACLDADGRTLAEGALVVLAAARESAALAPAPLWLHAVRGQVTLGSHAPGLALPPHAVNGHGHLLPQLPGADGPRWMIGSTYGRGDTSADVRPADHAVNLERLAGLLPGLARQLAPLVAAGRVQGWAGVRCTSHDRRPLVGELAPGLWVSTAMGSRGLTFAALCAELIAARLHAEPLPLAARLAQALDASRQRDSALSGLSS